MEIDILCFAQKYFLSYSWVFYGKNINTGEICHMRKFVSCDKDFAEILHMPVNVYRLVMIENYNALFDWEHESSAEIFFKNKDDAQKAIEWINEALVAIKLLESAGN